MVKENILNIKESIQLGCSKINCDSNSVTVVAVTKGRPTAQIEEALAAGITDIGENRVQESLLKYKDLRATNYLPAGQARLPDGQAGELRVITWHLVGHLQTNKVKEAVGIFNLIQSVDSLHLAQEIDKQAAKINKIQDILIEVKTSPEAKFGLKPDETIEVIKQINKLKNIKIKGLMTIAPVVDNPEKTRPYFRALRELRDTINKLLTVNCQLSTLSMGMSDDFKIAIEEGSNMVRLGRAIFEG